MSLRAFAEHMKASSIQWTARIWTLAAASAIVAACAGSPFEAEPRQHLDVLFIGNSYTFYNDMPKMLEQVAIDAGKGRTINTSMAVQGGASLQNHWLRGLAQDSIEKGPWDYVVLQEWSQGPVDNYGNFEEYAALFDEVIRDAGSEPLLFLTWAPLFMADTQSAITAAYKKVGRKIDARIAPVGPAWYEALATNATLQLFDTDESHPAPLGSYLAAAVFYAVLFRESPESSAGTSEQQLLRRIAWEVAQDYLN